MSRQCLALAATSQQECVILITQQYYAFIYHDGDTRQFNELRSWKKVSRQPNELLSGG